MLIPTLSSTKSLIHNSLETQPKAALETYFTTTTTKTVSNREPIELLEKHTKPEERESTMLKICGWKSFVKIKRAQKLKQSSLDMVARNKSNHISVVDTSRFSHKTTARCALNVKRDVPKPKTRTLHLVPCQKLQVSTTSQSTEYRRQLTSQSSVSFGASTPPPCRQLRLCKALHVQNTAIDSHQVAIEVHR